MDERKKLPGPFTLLAAGRRTVRKIVLVMVLLALYVLSSGPAQMIAFRIVPARGGQPATVELGKWWPKVYAPLVWFVDERLVESWSGALKWYWRLFPIR